MKKIVFAFFLILSAATIYFVVVAYFTPAWLLGEEIDSPKSYTQINESDLKQYPMLARFLSLLAKNPQPPQYGISGLVRGANYEGKSLQKFLRPDPASPTAAYPYSIEYEGKYYGLDLLFQFQTPLVL